ncbi:helix-turn-helix domain-containing protein [Arthrobacter sp. NPDC092385]|uniref:helix-turn-helix domain-containing protein n=1 Tax=Arthrobacter sp. NPDC092385 TaxID=3363943 RepID=UPI0037FDD183
MTTQRIAGTIGGQLLTWRKLLGLTAEQVADRAGISRNTLRKLEKGELGVGFEAFLNVARVLGLSEQLEAAFDPYETDFGRARAEQKLPQRVRR